MAKSDVAIRGVISKFADGPNCYPAAESRKNCAGTSPLTKAAGTQRWYSPVCSW